MRQIQCTHRLQRMGALIGHIEYEYAAHAESCLEIISANTLATTFVSPPGFQTAYRGTETSGPARGRKMTLRGRNSSRFSGINAMPAPPATNERAVCIRPTCCVLFGTTPCHLHKSSTNSRKSG